MSESLDFLDLEIAYSLLYNYEFYARHIQKIEPKDLQERDEGFARRLEALRDEHDNNLAGMVPLVFQPGQLKLHNFVTEMKRRRGLVRAALVKPRQVGWSTYIQGRANWLASTVPGFKVHIVSHTADSTNKFLRRARKMCLAAPPGVAEGRQIENSKELVFSNGSSYSIATAGSPDAMRSDSCHFLHGSELPYWKQMQETFGAVIPALSDGLGSEGYLESSSKGRETPWHKFIQKVIAGQNEWEIFFDEWFNHPRYRATPPPGWQPNDEAIETQRLYNLSIEQLYWRAMKIESLGALWLFKQEYPATIDESFQSSGDTLYNPDAITRARRNAATMLPDPYAPLIMGVDPARRGDRTAICFRQGKVILEVMTWDRMEGMRLVGIIANFLKNGYKGKKVSKVFMDYAMGDDVADRLRELGFGAEVTTVHFGESPADAKYANKRTEMYFDFKDWLGETGEFVALPDSHDIAADLLAIPDFMQTTSSDKIGLAPKSKIKEEYGRSPDIADAIVLTFAWPVAAERTAEMQKFARDNFSHMKPTELAAVLDDFSR